MTPEPLSPASPALTAPRFYVTPRQRVGPGSWLMAFCLALVCMGGVGYALRHTRGGHRAAAMFRMGSGADDSDDDDDDPSRVDTIYLGGPSQAPTTTRPRSRPSTVHPFVVVQLPRDGEGTGQIPDTQAGRLLYDWLAAFNSKDLSVVAKALPTPAGELSNEALLELRRETGGFTLVSAKEVQPGVVVFRMHDQTTAATESLGTLQMVPGSSPPKIGSFSLSEAPAPTTKTP